MKATTLVLVVEWPFQEQALHLDAIGPAAVLSWFPSKQCCMACFHLAWLGKCPVPNPDWTRQWSPVVSGGATSGSGAGEQSSFACMERMQPVGQPSLQPVCL